MPDRHPTPEVLCQLAARDPIGLQLYLRQVRSAYIGAMASALLRFVLRHLRRRFTAPPEDKVGEGYPLASEAKALVANLTAMR